MKLRMNMVLAALLILTQACAPVKGNVLPALSEVTVITAEVSTTLPQTGDTATVTPLPEGNSIPEGGITLQDNGRTIKMKVGDSVLLNLGANIYDWTVSVDNENVLRMKMGVLVIQGAQGIYDALASGTATLTAAGNPHCLQSNPPCGMPSILFSVTVIVE
jgi:hypothetical protein